LGRYWDADTLVYAVEYFFCQTLYWSGPPSPFYVHHTNLWRIHPALAEPWTDGYPRQFFEATNSPNSGEGSLVSWMPDTLYGFSQVYGKVMYPFEWGGCALVYKPTGTEEEVLPCDGCGTSFHRRHSVGLGLTSHTVSCFEAWDYGQLTGWVKGGDTTGIITPDSFFLVSTLPEPLSIPVRVAPNPSSGDWLLLFPDMATEPLRFTLSDLQGRLLQQGDIPQDAGQQRIPGAGWNAGVYLLQIQGKNGMKSLKLIRN
jgi:hypothetical protein